MIEIKTLKTIDPETFMQVMSGYTAHEKYKVVKTEDDMQVAIVLELVALPTPYVKVYDPLDDYTVEDYRELTKEGWSLGAYDGDTLIGMAITEHHVWNHSLWVWEFHIAETYRGQGVGRRLMEMLAQRCQKEGVRIIVCETQNTNVPAIRFYRSVGFQVEGVDISYYTNDDYPDGEIAMFMKRRITVTKDA